MNKHILMVIDHQLNPDKYTKEQLEKKADAATDAYTTATASAYAATAYAASYAYAATDATTYAAVWNAADATYWLNKYFNITGENKQDYIDELNKDNKQ